MNRKQLLRAVWQLFKRPGAALDIQPTFANRVKHLLDADRKTLRAGHGLEQERFAFFSTGPSGTGNAVAYSYDDLFALLIALELVDLGFPQREAIQVARVAKPLLRHHFDREETPTIPTFMMITRGELTEAYPKERRAGRGAIISSPVIVLGYDGLGLVWSKSPMMDRKRVFIEIGTYARDLRKTIEHVLT
nr:hypothetical protein [Nitrosomonas nitrosa]